MKNFLFGLLTLSFSVIANAQIPEWYTHEMNRLVGTWVADNTVYMNDQENDDAYAIEWRRGIGKKNLLGRLYGLKKGRLTNEYWQFIQYWDPAAKQAKVIQIATFGTKGEGYLEYRDSANTQLIQTFTNPNGTSWTSGHKTRIFDNYEISTSYQIDKQNNWKEQRTYTWYKQKESTKTEDKNYALYLTQIATAEALLQLNKISEARAYLESCASEYRDMEWHFLDKYLDQARQTITPPKPSALNAVCLSPDGKWLAVGTADSAILLYNFPDLKLIKTLHGHQGAVTSLDFSRDGKKLISGGRDHAVVLWDIASGQAQFKNDTSFSQGIYQVRFGPEDQMIGVVSWERRQTAPYIMGFATVLDPVSGKEVKKIDTEPHPAAGLVFSPDGKNMVVSCWGEITYSYHLESGQQNWNYDLSDPEEYNAFHSIALSPDGQTLLLGSTDKRIHVLDMNTGQLQRRLEPWEGHTKTVKSLQFSSDGKYFASAGEDQTVYIWQTSDFSKKHSLIGHTGTVNSLAWSKDGEKLLSASADGSLRKWDLQEPFEVHYEVCDYGPWQLPLNKDNSLFAAPCSDKHIALYQISNGEMLHDFEGPSGLCGDISEDGKYLVTAGFDGIVRLWDIQKGEPKCTLEGHTTRVDGVAYLDETGQIVSVGDTTLRVWDVATNKAIKIVSFNEHPFRVVASPDESSVYVGFSSGSVKVIQTNTWKEITHFSADAGINELAISPNGDYLAIFQKEHIEIRDALTGALRYHFKDHEKTGYGIGFSPDSRYLISGSYDQTFKLWNLERGLCTLTFHGIDANIYRTEILDEKRIILSTSQGGIFYYDFR